MCWSSDDYNPVCSLNADCNDILKNYAAWEKEGTRLGRSNEVSHKTHKFRSAVGTVDTVKYAFQA